MRKKLLAVLAALVILVTAISVIILPTALASDTTVYDYETHTGDLYAVRSPHRAGPVGYRAARYNGTVPANYKLFNKADNSYIQVYCSDYEIGVQVNYDFRRMKLEDSTVFSPEQAVYLRAVMLQTYPYLSLQEFIDHLEETITWHDLRGSRWKRRSPACRWRCGITPTEWIWNTPAPRRTLPTTVFLPTAVTTPTPPGKR